MAHHAQQTVIGSSGSSPELASVRFNYILLALCLREDN